jgi:hypothetical protein
MKCEVGRGVGPKLKTEPLWISFMCAVWNGDGGWCVWVAQWHVPGDGGGGVMQL